LRIGIKRFRYVVENFLPALHEAWSADLKELQDLLGEVHDLDVLWGTALQIHAFSNAEDRLAWEKKIGKEREQRLSQYREKMMGEGSLWQVWRGALPEGARIEAAALSRLKLWASHLDPDIRHSEHITRLALELFDGLGTPAGPQRERERSVLKLAALMHDIGRSKGEKGHHKASYRLLSKMKAPLGCEPADLSLAALVARYHQGVVPRAGHPGWTGLAPEERKTIFQLAGILRLANAFDAGHDGHIKRLEIAVSKSAIQVFAEGYSPRSPLAEQIAAARHLLEITYRRPVMIKTLRAAQSGARGRSATAAAGS